MTTTMQHQETAKATPYDLYIKLDTLIAGWESVAGRPEGIVIVCGFQSIELLWRLVQGALEDTRVTSSAEMRIDRFVEVIRRTQKEIGRGLAETSLPPQLMTAMRAERPSPGYEILASLTPGHRAEILNSFDEAFGDLPMDIGIERQLGRTCPWPEADHPTFDYVTLVAPERLLELSRDDPFGPEDQLFATVHQIVECWLRIVHSRVDQAERLAAAGMCGHAARAVRRAAAALELATLIARLLDSMVLADYHPLRVRLRDGSGAQSKAAQQLPRAGRRLLAGLEENLRRSHVSVLEVLETPTDYPALHALQAALQDFGRRCQAFLFEHFLLANTVLGTNNLGSLGFAVRTLGERAITSPLGDLDQAKYDLTVITNLRHGAHSGAIVMANELARKPECYYRLKSAATSCAPGLMEERVRQYFFCIEQRDASGWTSLFASDAVFRDSLASRPYVGRRHLQIFIDTMLSVFDDMRAEIGEVRIRGNDAEVDWSFHAVALGVPVEFSGREQFSFNDDGTIAQAQVLWDPADIAIQLRAAKTALKPADVMV